MNPSPTTARTSYLGRLAGTMLVGAAILAALAISGRTLAVVFDGIAPGLARASDAPLGSRLQAVREVALAELGEAPRVTPDDPTGPLPVCRGVSIHYGKPLRKAFALMRGTGEGRRLYALLLDHGACVRVDDLAFNAAYASARWTPLVGWSESEIVVDRRYVRSAAADVLAAILIHEATHLDRAMSGAACYLRDTCTLLPNGVQLEEEVAAHAAEAEWWLAAFGHDGKRFAFRADYSENQLVRAYRLGPEAFRAYVAELRGSDREGEGI